MTSKDPQTQRLGRKNPNQNEQEFQEFSFPSINNICLSEIFSGIYTLPPFRPITAFPPQKKTLPCATITCSSSQRFRGAQSNGDRAKSKMSKYPWVEMTSQGSPQFRRFPCQYCKVKKKVGIFLVFIKDHYGNITINKTNRYNGDGISGGSFTLVGRVDWSSWCGQAVDVYIYMYMYTYKYIYIQYIYIYTLGVQRPLEEWVFTKEQYF